MLLTKQPLVSVLPAQVFRTPLAQVILVSRPNVPSQNHDQNLKHTLYLYLYVCQHCQYGELGCARARALSSHEIFKSSL